MVDSKRLHLFKKGLQSYKKRNDFSGALRLVVNQIVKYMEDTPVAAKGSKFLEILDIVASDFSQLNLPLDLAHRIECVVDNLLSNGMVQEALMLTTASYPPNFKVPFLELHMRVLFNQGNMEEFWKIVRAWEVYKLFAYAETAYILGISLMNSEDKGSLQKSIDTFNKGISMAASDGQQSLVEKLEHMLSEAEKKKGERQLVVEEAEAVHIAPVTPQEATLALQQAIKEDK